MGGHTAVVCLVLLALCCVLLPRAGESAGGIVSLGQAVEEIGMEALYRQESQDEPAKEEDLTETQSQTSKEKRATEEDALPARVRRAEEEEEGKGDKKRGKKDKKDKKNKEPKVPKATKKPKADKKPKKGKEKEPRTEAPTTPPPTTTTLPPTTTTPPPTTTTEVYTEADYPYPDNEDDYWKPDEEEPAGPVVDPEDDYWKGEDPTATPPTPVVDGEVDKGDEDYWDARYEVPENLPFPDGKEVVPTEKDDWSYAVTEELVTPPPTYESPWYEEYDYGHSGRQTKKQEERENQRKEKEREDRERAQQREEEERAKAKKRPHVFKEPKKCPPLGMESHRIESDQLLASSMSHHRYSQARARLNIQASDDEEEMHGGAWCPNPEDNIHWFEMDARRATEFTGIITQGRDSRNEIDFVTSYYVQFSNDSREWKTIHDGYSDWLFFGNSDKDTPVLNQLAEPILARYIRVIPQSWNGSCCMRLEVLGCPLPDPTSAYQRLQNEVTPVQYLDFRHHNYSDMVTMMKSVSEECPNITSMYSLGRSSNGLDILAMVISGNPTEHEIGEPEFRYTAGLHGNEATGREMVLLLLQYLCKEYNDGNPRVRRLVEGIRIHLVPSLNPDGQEKALTVGSELSGWTTGHWTEDGHDIFQNFPDLNSVLWDAEDKGMVPKLTPNHHVKIPADQEGDDRIAVETRAIILWMESHPFVLGANFQGGERFVAYPYDNHRLTKTAGASTREGKRERAQSRKKRQYEEFEEPVEDHRNRGYQQPEEDQYNRRYQQPEEEWRGHGYGHREEEEEDDRGRGGYAEPEDEPRATADASFFRWLAISYASTHLSMTYTSHGSCHGNDITGGIGIVNRAKWQPVTGSMNDFSYLHTNCLELSVFLGCDKFPHQSELVIEWEKNREAMLTFMEQVQRGIRGVVKDNEGNPIANATVSVEGVNHDVSTAVTGDYWRLLNPGEYRVTVRAEGFAPLTKLCVVGYEAGAITCSFNLAKSNWDRIKQIMALHGNKPIRLLSHGNGGTRRNTPSNGNSHVEYPSFALMIASETRHNRRQELGLDRPHHLRRRQKRCP
ncbi:inactive carboxypeptidase-like protein X2 [Salmo trutta]|uniref:inactive carboxypeptidase-like protein X2 n=1 Tax=Salmo trutta TaxID=8032 RepID=UPI00113295C2|nr:inactive carboxypeptidase-like protein X2 [Salmo trutta]